VDGIYLPLFTTEKYNKNKQRLDVRWNKIGGRKEPSESQNVITTYIYITNELLN
jgi:hypothetical protein